MCTTLIGITPADHQHEHEVVLTQFHHSMFTNVSWYAGVSKYDLENSALTTASLWFTNVLGSSTRVRGLNFLIALSAFGNMVSGSIGAARMIRECGRQGVLPWTDFWASTKPFGTPIGPYVFKWAITALIILAIPSGDAFNFSKFPQDRNRSRHIYCRNLT